MRNLFRDRVEAGRLLARELTRYANRPDVLVLGLPRGGVPVAFEVAKALRAPLDVVVVRKLGVPGQPELAMGAIASGGARVLNESLVSSLRIPESAIAAAAEEEEEELRRRELAYRGHRGAPKVHGKTIILVDDGIATGSTMRAAIQALKRQHPARLVIAVPTAAASSCGEIEPQVDELVTLMAPEDFGAVGQWFEEFPQVSDAEVTDLLDRAGHSPAPAESATAPARRGGP
jgi:putative phosphoribosyl transferase